MSSLKGTEIILNLKEFRETAFRNGDLKVKTKRPHYNLGLEYLILKSCIQLDQ